MTVEVILTAPHGAQLLELVEDHEDPGMRIYMLREPGTKNAIGLTGEEFAYLAQIWESETKRRFLHDHLLEA